MRGEGPGCGVDQAAGGIGGRQGKVAVELPRHVHGVDVGEINTQDDAIRQLLVDSDFPLQRLGILEVRIHVIGAQPDRWALDGLLILLGCEHREVAQRRLRQIDASRREGIGYLRGIGGGHRVSHTEFRIAAVE